MGDLSLLPTHRTVTLHFRGFEEGCRAVGEAVCAQAYDPATHTLSVTLQALPTANEICVTLENAATYENKYLKEDVFDFLMEAQLPVEEKTEINRVCSTAKSKQDIAVALNNIPMSDSTRDALYEIIFCM